MKNSMYVLSVPENFACNGIIRKPGDFVIRDQSGRQEVYPKEKFQCMMIEIAGNKEAGKRSCRIGLPLC